MTVLHCLPRGLAIAAAALALSVSQSALAQGSPHKGGTLVIVVQPEPPTLASYIKPPWAMVNDGHTVLILGILGNAFVGLANSLLAGVPRSDAGHLGTPRVQAPT